MHVQYAARQLEILGSQKTSLKIWSKRGKLANAFELKSTNANYRIIFGLSPICLYRNMTFF